MILESWEADKKDFWIRRMVVQHPWGKEIARRR